MLTTIETDKLMTGNEHDGKTGHGGTFSEMIMNNVYKGYEDMHVSQGKRSRS